jgi:hypothetical protein
MDIMATEKALKKFHKRKYFIGELNKLRIGQSLIFNLTECGFFTSKSVVRWVYDSKRRGMISGRLSTHKLGDGKVEIRRLNI